MNSGVESSFITDINFTFTRSVFELFIARDISENSVDQTKTLQERNLWKQVNLRIVKHASEHFNRYRQVVASMQQEITQIFQVLPNGIQMVKLPQRQLETYVYSLLAYLTARLAYELWQTTCQWEHKDYPTLLKELPIFATLRPACGPAPVVPQKPIMPLIVTPGRATQLTPP